MSTVARHLGALRERVVFVGGATLELLITDPSAGPVRPTEDVDLIVPAVTRVEFLRDIAEQLRAAGFKPDVRENAPICRWVVAEVTVDVMPTLTDILGFTNRWYAAAVAEAPWLEVGAGLRVKVMSAPYFIATKLEAFKGRGRGDFLGSADIEDVIAIVDGRVELLVEVQKSPMDLREYLAHEISALLSQEGFADAVEGYFLWDAGSQRRKISLRDRLGQLRSP